MGNHRRQAERRFSGGPESSLRAPGEADNLVDKAEQVVFDLSQARVTGEFTHIDELLKEGFERITALYEAGADITGVPSGFRDLDRLTSGFQPGNLIIAAARPSTGKSALGLCTAANLAGSREARRDLRARDIEVREESDQQGPAEVILAKHRNGPTDAVKLSFLKRYAKFADLAAATYAIGR